LLAALSAAGSQNLPPNWTEVLIEINAIFVLDGHLTTNQLLMIVTEEDAG
jgi:hypothetical protein